MKKSLLGLLLAMLALTACGGDEIQKIGTGGEPAEDARLVSKVVLLDEDGDDEATYTFSYDDRNRVTKMELVIPDGGSYLYDRYLYVYTDDKIVVENEYGGEGQDESGSYTLTIGKNGYVSQFSATDGVQTLSADYSYASDGRLQRVSIPHADISVACVWTGGNITGCDWFQGKELMEAYVFEFSDVANHPKCNLDLNMIVCEDFCLSDPSAAILRLFGRSTDNMLSVVSDGYDMIEYEYETDDEGFVTKAIMLNAGRKGAEIRVEYK